MTDDGLAERRALDLFVTTQHFSPLIPTDLGFTRWGGARFGSVAARARNSRVAEGALTQRDVEEWMPSE